MHWALVVHLVTQAWVTVLQTKPFVQSPSPMHAMQVLVAVSHRVRPWTLAQAASAVHWTQVNVFVSQERRVPVVQLASPMHCTHVLLAASQ